MLKGFSTQRIVEVRMLIGVLQISSKLGAGKVLYK